ncbi:MAG: class I SAM-dependent methyltransferase [bacterium]|jgi:S-adenosylmethionine-dependent methyltransferase
MVNPVADYYDQNPELEWNRLVTSPYRRMEYEVVLYFLEQFLPPAGHILDLGGGPGRYAVYLAKRGYQVTLVDLAPENIRFAREKFRNAGLLKQVQGFYTADAVNLDFLTAHTFDAVLCLGPLYHLPEQSDRLQCLHECHRVLKQGAPLFLMVIPPASYFRDALRSGLFDQTARQDPAVFAEILQEGTSPRSQVPNMYFCGDKEVRELLRRTDFLPVQFASVHGAAAFLDEQVNRIGKDVTFWNLLVQLVIETCTDAGQFSAAEHLLGIAKKV